MKYSLPAVLALSVAFELVGFNTEEPVFKLSPFTVEESRLNDSEIILGIGHIEAASPDLGAISVGESMATGPGISMQRRGSGSLEPNLRGFNLDRVTVSFNGLMVPAASPTRTGSPVNFVPAGGITELLVVTGFPSVADGPIPVGGRVAIRMDANYPSSDQLNFSISSNPSGGRVSANSNLVQSERLSLKAGVHYSDYGSYESGSSGLRVDEMYRGWGTIAALAYQQDNGNQLDLALNFFRQIEATNTSLPLDTKDADAVYLTAGYVAEVGAGELELKIGHSRTTPNLTSESRIIPGAAPLKSIVADSEATSQSLKIGYKLELNNSTHFEFGFDHLVQARDAMRTRSLKSGAVFKDTIWPDVEAEHSGVFVELASERNRELEWRFGARVGRSSTEAKPADDPVMGIPGSKGPTVIDNYIAYNGADAADVEADDTTYGANAIVQWWISDELRLMAGAGITAAPPGIGERYRAFLNALGGGVELGNPALEPEIKQTASIGFAYKTQRLTLSSEIWLAEVKDYVTRMAVSTSPLIYSFRNQDANFHGMEMNLLWQPFDETVLRDLRLNASASIINGENDTSGRDIVEVPPWDCWIGLSWDRLVKDGAFSMKLSGHYVDGAVNPDPVLNPIYKDSGAWFDLRAEISLQRQNWLFRLVLDNAFDRLGYAYLQPPVATGPILPAGGDLSPGDRIPLPGRSLSLQISYFY